VYNSQEDYYGEQPLGPEYAEVKVHYPEEYSEIRDEIVSARYLLIADLNFLITDPIYEDELPTIQDDRTKVSAGVDRLFARLNALKANIEQSETKTITLPTGSYEITQINEEITRHFSTKYFATQERAGLDPPITVTSNPATLNCVIEVTSNRYTVDLSASTIRTVLGFSGRTLHKGRHESDQPVNIMPVSSILVKCSIIGGSYVAGSEHPVLHAFFPDVSPGYKVIETPQNVLYLPVTLSGQIQNIRIWLTDQNHIPLDLRGEKITIRCALVGE
jgi:hypothetical protein